MPEVLCPGESWDACWGAGGASTTSTRGDVVLSWPTGGGHGRSFITLISTAGRQKNREREGTERAKSKRKKEEAEKNDAWTEKQTMERADRQKIPKERTRGKEEEKGGREEKEKRKIVNEWKKVSRSVQTRLGEGHKSTMLEKRT